MKNIKLNKWYDYQFLLGNKLLLNYHIESACRNFWIDIVDNIDEGLYILVQFKILKSDGTYKSISYVQTINKTDLDRLIGLFKEYWSLRDDHYKQFSVDSIVFTYKIMGGTVSSSLVHHRKAATSIKEPFKIGTLKLPKTMDVTKWSGDVVFSPDYTTAIVSVNNSVREYHVTFHNDYQDVKVMLGKDIVLEFKDRVDDVSALSTFTRTVKSQTYKFVNGELVVKQISRKAKFLSTIDKDSSISSKFVTMDLETRTIDGKMIPY